jgi:hypothetical protein
MVALVILGGIRRIGAVASRLVPTMILVYFAFGTIVLITNISLIPQAFGMIFEYAFSPAAATGGFLGATIRQALQFGARRGILSNEAGLGSAPIAHAAAQTPGPIYQGLIGVAEVFIDTIVVCTFTAIILISSGVWNSGLEGAAMTASAFSDTVPYIGGGSRGCSLIPVRVLDADRLVLLRRAMSEISVRCSHHRVVSCRFYQPDVHRRLGLDRDRLLHRRYCQRIHGVPKPHRSDAVVRSGRTHYQGGTGEGSAPERLTKDQSVTCIYSD